MPKTRLNKQPGDEFNWPLPNSFHCCFMGAVSGALLSYSLLPLASWAQTEQCDAESAAWRIEEAKGKTLGKWLEI